MSGEQPLTFEEMQSKLTSIEANQTKIFKAQEEDEKEKEARRKAIEEKKDYTEAKHKAQNDDDKEKEAQNEKDKENEAALKAAITAIANENDEDKHEEMYKKAQEMMDENKKKNHEARKSQEEDEDKKDARISQLEDKEKEKTSSAILKVASIINPKEIKQITKDLKTASLEEVENLWNKHYKSFSASLGVKNSPQSVEKFVPFQMNAALEGDGDEDNMYTASTPKEFSQLDTEKLMQRATEMYH